MLGSAINQNSEPAKEDWKPRGVPPLAVSRSLSAAGHSFDDRFLLVGLLYSASSRKSLRPSNLPLVNWANTMNFALTSSEMRCCFGICTNRSSVFFVCTSSIRESPGQGKTKT